MLLMCHFSRSEIQLASDYRASANTGWVSWSISTFIKRPLAWSYRSVVKSSLSWAYGMIYGKQNNDVYRPKSRVELLGELPDEQYVILDLVQVSGYHEINFKILILKFCIHMEFE